MHFFVSKDGSDKLLLKAGIQRLGTLYGREFSLERKEMEFLMVGTTDSIVVTALVSDCGGDGGGFDNFCCHDCHRLPSIAVVG